MQTPSELNLFINIMKISRDPVLLTIHTIQSTITPIISMVSIVYLFLEIISEEI